MTFVLQLPYSQRTKHAVHSKMSHSIYAHKVYSRTKLVGMQLLHFPPAHFSTANKINWGGRDIAFDVSNIV